MTIRKGIEFSKEQHWLINNIKTWDQKSAYLVYSNTVTDGYYFCTITSAPSHCRLNHEQWSLSEKNDRPTPDTSTEHTGLSVSYYDIIIPANSHSNPEHNEPKPIVVSCNDIIEALRMNYACANVFKAVWRICASKMGKMKKGNNTLYDAEKSVFFSNRILIQEKNNVK